MLQRTFPFVQFLEIRPIVLSLLKVSRIPVPSTFFLADQYRQRHPQIPLPFLEKLSTSPELYAECPIEVCRGLFRASNPSVTCDFNEGKEADLGQKGEIVQRGCGSAPGGVRYRQQNPVVQQLTKMIGSSFDLYNIVLQYLRMKFVKSKLDCFGTLRTDLVMALHDQESSVVYQRDPCHRFGWCLTAAVRERVLESKHLKELSSIIATPPKELALWGDLCMMMADPFTSSAFLLHAYSLLRQSLASFSLPRENDALVTVLTMVAAGQRASEMIEKRQFTAPIVPVELIVVFLPALALVMADEMLAKEDIKDFTVLKKSAQSTKASRDILCSFIQV